MKQLRLGYLIFAVLGALALAPASASAAGKRVALVIGDSAYQYTHPLENPANDARLMTQTLQQLGFVVSTVTDASKMQLERQLLEFSRNADDADVAAIYYAGHGVQANGRNYLVPVDARLEDELSLQVEAVDLDVVLQSVAQAQASLVFIDACRDNPLAAQMRIKGGGRGGGNRGLARIDHPPGGTLIAFATAPDTVAGDGAGGNSPFTSALSKYLLEPGLEIRQVLTRVRKSVREATANRQEPRSDDGLTADLFLLPSTTAMAVNDPASHALYPTPAMPAAAQLPVPAVSSASGANQDCGECPAMVHIPSGTYQMGSGNFIVGLFGPNSKLDTDAESPQHRVTLRSFWMSESPVTLAQWDACAAARGCNAQPTDEGWGRGNQPAINISWDDAQQYVRWLSQKTGRQYRLPSEAEWEYAARAGTRTRYWWGDDTGSSHANCAGCGSRWDSRQAAPTGSFAANAFLLRDMLGNVFQWTQDCWHDGYTGAPENGAPWSSGSSCNYRVARGGSWSSPADELRTAFRTRFVAAQAFSNVGLRVVRSE